MPPRRKAQPLVAEIITPATAIEQEEEAIIETVNETVEEEEEVEAEGSNDPAMNDRLAKMAALRQRMVSFNCTNSPRKIKINISHSNIIILLFPLLILYRT